MDFKKARFNMVEQQIRPWDVLDFAVLDALESIPREEFVLPEQQGYAYADLPLKLLNGSYMLEPKIVARLAQGLNLKKTDQVLEIGTGACYATAVLAYLAAHVHTVDMDAQQQNFAHIALNRINLLNISYEVCDGFAQDKNTRYDAIYVGGSLPAIPEVLKNRLNENGGRMVVIVGSEPVQRCMLITRQGIDFSEKVLFDTLVPPLNGTSLTSHNKFVF